MYNFQSFLKNVRDSKELKRETIADAINLSVETIKLIEEAENDSLLLNSSSVLKNQIRRYCEYLEIPEKKIVSILNKIDILYYKKSRYGKLKFFDYINRLAILIIAIAIIVLVTQHIRKNIHPVTPENSKSAIIYTPINYDIVNSEQQQPSISSDTINVKPTDNTDPNKASEIPATAADNSTATKTLVAHPPTTANINNVVIDDETTSQSQNN
ncbi:MULTISPECIES: helix-turn-helix domain-containing protein [Francisella]|uniref:DNA-binding protein n=1 Tax=Francisella opportunistica TaxID=2016517 RepID=A0A345JSA3_9GAMM|nr:MULTISPECIES: helix-turn-helix domain-containing protein [Francisella]APC91963.1 Putative membrane protein [Francisella sp. MA067296]AXH30199.1 DNA-binding protein [Francisella opportunistica]AXH31840.1 DNA-binding protein [Francisella opportunistica]AXH33486.1 DNA-binding protein [Francisella opportunistica]